MEGHSNVPPLNTAWALDSSVGLAMRQILFCIHPPSVYNLPPGAGLGSLGQGSGGISVGSLVRVSKASSEAD